MDDELRKQLLAHVDHRRGRTPLFLYILGLAFVAVAITGVFGGEHLLPAFLPYLGYFCLGMLFLYVGALVQERERLGAAFRELVESFEAFNQTIYGRNYKVRRNAVEILVSSLRSGDANVRGKVHEQLVRLTGQGLPPDSAAWERWWAENRATYGAAPGGNGSDATE